MSDGVSPPISLIRTYAFSKDNEKNGFSSDTMNNNRNNNKTKTVVLKLFHSSIDKISWS